MKAFLRQWCYYLPFVIFVQVPGMYRTFREPGYNGYLLGHRTNTRGRWWAFKTAVSVMWSVFWMREVPNEGRAGA